MRIYIDPPDGGPHQNWLTRLIDALRGTEVVTPYEAAPYIILLSPGEKSFKVEVDDSGNLTTTELPPGYARE